MRKLLAIALITLGSLIMVAPMATATPPADKVTICHRTNADANPYVQITVDTHAVNGVGGADHYGQHKGPVWNPTLKMQKVKWGDIIPPVPGVHEGLNWTEGATIYKNGCTVAPTTTTTVPEETTTTVDTSSTTVPKTVGDSPPSAPSAQRTAEPAPAALESLPVTGAGDFALAMVAVGLIVLGLYLVKRGSGY